MTYDIIIRNGTVFDGSGNAPQKIDIGIKGDEIKRLDNLDGEKANKTIEADGKYVCPGFIDLTNHSDTHWALFDHPRQESLVRQGITTIVGGACGLSLAPLTSHAGIENISKWVDPSKLNISWQTMGEFLSYLEERKLALNFATLVGFNTLYNELPESEDKFKQIKLLLKSSIKEGAFGMSTSLGSIPKHFLRDDDLIELFEVAKKEDCITKHHLEDEGKEILPAISRLINITRASKSKIHISHFKVLGKSAWDSFGDALKIIRNARAEGIKLTCDFFPYEKTGSDLFTFLPSWLKNLSAKDIKETLSSKENENREKVKDYLKSLTLHYDKIVVASSTHNSNEILGKTIKQVSGIFELDEEETVLELLLSNNLHVSIFNEVIKSEHILELAGEKYFAISSDGSGYDKDTKNDLPHPRSFGTFPRAFHLFLRENKVSKWEDLIYKMSGLPAEILGIKDRGIIAKNKKADIIIFDPEKIGDYSTYDNPFQFSKGIEHAIINGLLFLEKGQLGDCLAGRVLRKK